MSEEQLHQVVGGGFADSGILNGLNNLPTLEHIYKDDDIVKDITEFTKNNILLQNVQRMFAQDDGQPK